MSLEVRSHLILGPLRLTVAVTRAELGAPALVESGTPIPGTSFRLTFLPVQEHLPEPGFVLKNCLASRNRDSGKAKHLTCKSAVLKQFATFQFGRESA